MSIKQEIQKLQKEQKRFLEEMKEKYRISGAFALYQKARYVEVMKKIVNHLRNHNAEVIMNTGTLENTIVDFSAADPDCNNYKIRWEIEEEIQKYILLITNQKNIWEALSLAAIEDKEWTKKRNEGYLEIAFIKYIYKDEYKQKIIDYMQKIIDKNIGIEEDYNRYCTINKEISMLKNKVKDKTAVFTTYKSWETGITFYILETRLPKELFALLVKEAGLFYHKPDPELEENFEGWTIREHLDKAEKILSENDYIIEN